MAETYEVQNMDFNELCDILDALEVDYSDLEDIDDLRDLVVQSVAHQNSSDTTSQAQEQVKYNQETGQKAKNIPIYRLSNARTVHLALVV